MTLNFKISIYLRSQNVRKPKSSNILLQRKNFVKSVRKRYGNSDSHAFTMLFGNYSYIFIENFSQKFSPFRFTYRLSLRMKLITFFKKFQKQRWRITKQHSNNRKGNREKNKCHGTVAKWRNVRMLSETEDERGVPVARRCVGLNLLFRIPVIYIVKNKQKKTKVSRSSGSSTRHGATTLRVFSVSCIYVYIAQLCLYSFESPASQRASSALDLSM